MNNKRLYRVEDGKMLCGVCGGIAEYFNIDPTIVRVLWVLGSLCIGTGVLAYIILAFVVPEKSQVVGGNIQSENGTKEK